MEKNIYQEIKNLKTLKEVNEFRNSIDEAINEQEESIRAKEFISSLNGKSFGFIKENFENLSNELFKTKKGRTIINNYVSCVKTNQPLLKMHQIYECIRKADKDGDVDSYLNEAISLIGEVDKKNYIKSRSDVAKVFAEAYNELRKTKSNDDIQMMFENRDGFYNSVDFVMFNKKSPRNLAEYNAKMSNIKKQIAEGAGYKITESKNIDEMVDELMENFNKKYGDQLENGVVELVKEMFVNEDKESVFNKYKEQCINKLNETRKGFEESGDTDSSTRLTTIIERINKKSYNPETVNNDVYNLIEISTID